MTSATTDPVVPLITDQGAAALPEARLRSWLLAVVVAGLALAVALTLLAVVTARKTGSTPAQVVPAGAGGAVPAPVSGVTSGSASG